MFIYVITNSTTGKIYIGQHKGTNLKKYLQDKLSHAKFKRDGSILFNSMRKHPKEVWSIEPIFEVETKIELDRMERLLIALYDTRNPEVGYNICKGGEGRTGPLSEETKKKMSASRTGLKRSPEARANMSAAQRLLPHLYRPTPAKDMSGEVINDIEIVKRGTNAKNGKATWLCRCHCGNPFSADGTSLRTGHTKSCGCQQRGGGLVDMTGDTLSGVTVLNRRDNDKRGNALWLCRCKCGKEFTTKGSHLRGGSVKGCGCSRGRRILPKSTVLVG